MIYLAQVERQQRLKSPRLCLLSEKLPNKLWKPVASTSDRLINLPHQYHHLAESVLVIVELNSKREVVVLHPGLPEILAVFSDWTRRVSETNSEKARIDEWKESLSLQAYELSSRASQLEAMEIKFKTERTAWQKLITATKEHNDAMRAEMALLKEEIKKSTQL